MNGPDSARSLRDEADELLAAHRADEAAVLLRALTIEHPTDGWAWQRLAAALLAGEGGAEADAEAKVAAERGVALDPASAIGYRMLTEAALRLGDRDAALSAMRAAVRAAPDSWVTHLDLASALVDQPGGGAEAWRMAKRAAGLAPDRAEPYLMLGDLAMRAGDLDKAAAGYADALDRAPGNGLVTRKLAELHHRLEAPTTLLAPVPPEVPDHRPAVRLGNALAVQSALAAAVAAMLAVLRPSGTTVWYPIVAGVAGGGLLLVAGALLAGTRQARGHLPPGGGFRVGFGVSGVLGALAALGTLGAGLAGSTLGLRIDLCVALAGYVAGHVTARWAARADEPATVPRRGAYLGLAGGNLLAGLGFGALAALSMVLRIGTYQVVGVLVVVVLLLAAAGQVGALGGRTPRTGAFLATLTGIATLYGAATVLAALFTAPTVVPPVTAALCALALAVCSALAAAVRR